jgi:uncharacterized protein YciI
MHKMKYYFCKFLPPRKDFVKTMTPDEAKLFKAHGTYLQGLLEMGQVVAHGPVMDPTGGFGLSLFAIEDGEDISALTAGDPMIEANVGARYETYSMMGLRARG